MDKRLHYHFQTTTHHSATVPQPSQQTPPSSSMAALISSNHGCLGFSRLLRLFCPLSALGSGCAPSGKAKAISMRAHATPFPFQQWSVPSRPVRQVHRPFFYKGNLRSCFGTIYGGTSDLAELAPGGGHGCTPDRMQGMDGYGRAVYGEKLC